RGGAQGPHARDAQRRRVRPGRRAGLRPGSAAVVGLDLDDLDGDLTPVGGRVGALLALLQADDRGAERARLAVDVEVRVRGDLATAEEEHLFAAGDDGGHDGARLDDTGAGRRLADRGILQQRLQRADAGLLLALLVLRRVIAAV